MVKIYTQNVPNVIKQIHKHNDMYYESPPLHPALIVQSLKNLNENKIINILNQLYQTTNKKIRLLASKQLVNKIQQHKQIQIQHINIIPLWAKLFNFIPVFATATYSSLNFKDIGNFVISIGNGPNLFLQPLLTTFHIAILTDTPKPKTFVNHALIRPEIVIIYKNKNVLSHVTKIRKGSLGKPTILINNLEELQPIFQKALHIFNKMPFRWVDKLKNLS